MEPGIRKTRGILIIVMFIVLFFGPRAGLAQGPGQQSGVSSNNTSRPLSTGVSGSALFRRELSVTLSADDLSVWSDAHYDVSGDWTYILDFPYVEILEVDSTGGFYSIDGNQIHFTGLEGYFKVVFRTNEAVTREGQFFTFGGYASGSAPFDLEARIGYPEFYSDYIVSVTPEGYVQGPADVTWSLTDTTDFSFELQFDLESNLLTAEFLSGNQTAHHTNLWPANVFRRAQWVNVMVNFDGAFDPNTSSLVWSVKGPGEADFTEIPVWTPDLPETSWAVREGTPIDQSRTDEIFIPAGAPVGRYTLAVALYKDTGEGNVFQGDTTTPEFYVIFNPWNDDDDTRFDADVYNPNFSQAELEWYTLNGSDVNFYPDGGAPVPWVLSPYEEVVFLPAISEIEGISSARDAMRLLVDKTRWGENESNSDILEGRWGPGSYNVNWQDVPAIINAWNGGATHPTGQCMDFGGLVAAFGRAVGIPSRMLTCINCADLHGGQPWNFHVWDEVWVNQVNPNAWSPADGTYDIGPVTHQDPDVQTEVSTSNGIYTYDAATGTKINILNDYTGGRNSPLKSEPITAQDTSLQVSSSKPIYDFGETATIVVTATNTSTSSFAGDLQTTIFFVDYAGTYEVLKYPVRNVNIPVGNTITETYTLSQADYEWNGDFRASATLGGASAQGDFSINDGLDLQLIVPTDVVISDTFNYSLIITNTLPTPISNVDVEIYYPVSVIGATTPAAFTIPSLGPGQSQIHSASIGIGSAGLQQIRALVVSPDAGYDKISQTVDVLGDADLGVTIEVPEPVTPNQPFKVVARVRNAGGLGATNTQVALALSDDLTTNDPLVVSLGTIAGTQVQTATWSVTALKAGIHSVQVSATETSVNNQEVASQQVIAVQEDHDLKLTANQSTVLSSEPVTVTLTLENLVALQDRVMLDVVSTNPTIGFKVYHKGAGLEPPIVVPVPGEGKEEVALVIDPAEFESGQIRVKAVSELDPTAVDFLTINVGVGALPNNVFLPIVLELGPIRE